MTSTLNYTTLAEEEIEYIEIGPADELSPGDRMIVEIDGEAIAVFNIGEKIACPRHGALFDLRSGKALTLPAVVDIPAYPVRIEAGTLLIGIPRAWSEALDA